MNKTATLIKEAREAIISLNENLMEKSAALDTYEHAVKLAFTLVKEGHLAIEDVESKIHDFKKKSVEELNVIEKALEFSKTSEFNGFTLSSKADLNTLSAEDRLINAILY